jgi:biotin carboxyl carrier protein
MISYFVAEGDVLKAGQPFCAVESMKMEVKISVPDAFNGMVVKGLPCSVRTEEKQGDLVLPGDLLLEAKDSCAKVWK